MTVRVRRAALCALVLTGCGVEETGIAPPIDALYFPLGMAAHPDGRYLYVANADFDRKYNRGTVTVYDTFTQRLLPDATVEIGLFAGEVRVAKVNGVVKAYVPTRDNHALNVLTVDATAGNAPTHLRCEQRQNEAAERDSIPRVCDGNDVIDLFEGEVTTVPVASDPYDVALDETGLFVSHVGDGVVSRWAYGGNTAASPPLDFGCSLSLPAGADSVAIHPALNWAYLTDKTSDQVQVVEVLAPNQLGERGTTTREQCRLETRTPLQIGAPGTTASTRGLAFSADGTLLYVASSVDSSLRVFDTSIGPGGQPRNRLVATIPLGSGPDVVRVAGLRPGETRVPTEPDDSPVRQVVDAKGGGLVYVSSFDNDQVIVIDPTTLAVVARIDVGDGPHEIVFMPDGDGNLRGYVSNFSGNNLSVLDLEPGSPRRFTLLSLVP